MNLDVSVVPNITGRVSRVPLSPEDMSFLKSEGWENKLPDTLPSRAEFVSIEMLIGNDYYFDLLLPRKMELRGGLSLMQSRLGWILGQATSNMTEVPTLMVNAPGMVPPGVKVTTHMFSTVDAPLLTRPNRLEITPNGTRQKWYTCKLFSRSDFAKSFSQRNLMTSLS